MAVFQPSFLLDVISIWALGVRFTFVCGMVASVLCTRGLGLHIRVLTYPFETTMLQQRLGTNTCMSKIPQFDQNSCRKFVVCISKSTFYSGVFYKVASTMVGCGLLMRCLRRRSLSCRCRSHEFHRLHSRSHALRRPRQFQWCRRQRSLR